MNDKSVELGFVSFDQFESKLLDLLQEYKRIQVGDCPEQIQVQILGFDYDQEVKFLQDVKVAMTIEVDDFLQSFREYLGLSLVKQKQFLLDFAREPKKIVVTKNGKPLFVAYRQRVFVSKNISYENDIQDPYWIAKIIDRVQENHVELPPQLPKNHGTRYV